MKLTRRQIIAMIPAAGLLSVGAPLLAHAETPTDPERVRANTLAMLAGTAEANVLPEAAAKVDATVAAARTYLDDMDAAGADEIFAGLPLGESDPNLASTTSRLQQIALATRMPGSELEGDAQTQRRVIDGLERLHEQWLADTDAGYYGNWFTWEIGFPGDVTRALLLLADEVNEHSPDLTSSYIATMDAYLRNGVDGDVDLDSRFHTGANLADITTNRILQGAISGDEARITKAIEDQATVFATIDPYHLEHGVTDGHYADGSFIQHGSVAYTGSYGKGLLTRVVQTITILDGTSAASTDDLVSVVVGWVRNGFAPVIYEGWMMEIVKGRAVSRPGTGYSDVAGVAEAVVDLADYATGADAGELRSYAKHLDEAAAIDPAAFTSPVSIARLTRLRADDSIPAADLNPESASTAFNAMERTVHRRPGFAFALARSSERISRYEYMNGENLMPWFQGEGAYHLYLSGQDQAEAFGVDYYTTVSPYRLAGVTAPVQERQSIPELYGENWYENPDHPLEFTSSSESQNTYVYFPQGTNAYSGGARLGDVGAAGMVCSDDVPYVDKQRGILPEDFVVYENAKATKSWFMLDEEIVVLAAGVEGGSGRDALTTVDSRIAAPGEQISITGTRRDGTRFSGTGSAPLRWARYANEAQGAVVGYVFLDGPDPVISLEEVTRSRRIVRQSNPDEEVTKQVFGVSLQHPARRRADTLAYVLAPGADEERLARCPQLVRVLRNTPWVQAVAHAGQGVVAANAFSRGAHVAGPLLVHDEASVILATRDGATQVALSDPTMARRTVSVTLMGRWLEPTSADDGVTVRRVLGGTVITADTEEAYGASLSVTLR